jgi:hypothetical protein
MKISSDQSTAISSGAPARLDELSPAQARTGTRIGGTGTGDDLVDVSSLAEQLARASAGEEGEQTQKVGRLAAIYRSGEYRTDALEASRALIRDALARGTETSE